MGARVGKDHLRTESGQSVLEFILMLPMMGILTFMLIKINTVMQISIVNQKYARAQAIFLAANSPYYPGLRLRESSLSSKGFNQMIIGVSANEIKGSEPPVANIYKITRSGVDGAEDPETPPLRSRVRVRTTVSLCTQQNVLAGGKPILEVKPIGDSAFEPGGEYNLNEGSHFELCRSAYQ